MKALFLIDILFVGDNFSVPFNFFSVFNIAISTADLYFSIILLGNPNLSDIFIVSTVSAGALSAICVASGASIAISLFCFCPSLNKLLLAPSFANLVFANINSPNPSIPTLLPSALVSSGLNLINLSVTFSIVLSASSLLVALLLI